MMLFHVYVFVCLFRSIVTLAVSVAVCEIFSIKDWCDLENSVRVCSKSLKMAPFDRSHTSSYSSFIVTMAGRIISHFGDIQRQRMAWPWNVGLGLFKVIENGKVRQTMYDFLLVHHCNYNSILYCLRVIWRWIISWPWNQGVRGHSRSLKLVP